MDCFTNNVKDKFKRYFAYVYIQILVSAFLNVWLWQE